MDKASDHHRKKKIKHSSEKKDAGQEETKTETKAETEVEYVEINVEDEIDSIFKEIKMYKQQKKSKQSKDAQKTKKVIEKGRKYTDDGLPIYTEEELGMNNPKAGTTPLCPFDCDCCH